MPEQLEPLCTTVSSKELFDPESNPTTCLSAIRCFDLCHKCRIFRTAWFRGREDKLKCKPQTKPEKIEILEKIRKLRKELKELNIELSAPPKRLMK